MPHGFSYSVLPRIAWSLMFELVERLDRDRDAALRFLDDLSVPFTNNLAERALRMLKVRQHISGAFRSSQGAERFATIRGYLQTAWQQGQSLWEVLRSVVQGQPWEPDTGYPPGGLYSVARIGRCRGDSTDRDGYAHPYSVLRCSTKLCSKRVSDNHRATAKFRQPAWLMDINKQNPFLSSLLDPMALM